MTSVNGDDASAHLDDHHVDMFSSDGGIEQFARSLEPEVSSSDGTPDEAGRIGAEAAATPSTPAATTSTPPAREVPDHHLRKLQDAVWRGSGVLHQVGLGRFDIDSLRRRDLAKPREKRVTSQGRRVPLEAVQEKNRATLKALHAELPPSSLDKMKRWGEAERLLDANVRIGEIAYGLSRIKSKELSRKAGTAHQLLPSDSAVWARPFEKLSPDEKRFWTESAYRMPTHDIRAALRQLRGDDSGIWKRFADSRSRHDDMYDAVREGTPADPSDDALGDIGGMERGEEYLKLAEAILRGCDKVPREQVLKTIQEAGKCNACTNSGVGMPKQLSDLPSYKRLERFYNKAENYVNRRRKRDRKLVNPFSDAAAHDFPVEVGM